jgi:DNA end-binding protein Ku
MAARAIASGTISFGLVSVPVKLYTATRSKSLSFNLLHDKDKSRLRQQYVCAKDNEVVERGSMVKGYEYAKDQYVVLTDEELKALEKQTDQSIEIEEFVPISQVDPIYFEKAYLLGPDKGGQKAYKLLCEAMDKAGKGALGKFSTRGRQQLVLLRQARGGLILHGLHYADEVSSFDEIDLPDGVHLKDNEIELAIQLIEQLGSKKFEPEKYEDEYRQRALALIEQKAAGEEIVVTSAAPAKAQVIDLMEALKASLAAKQGKGKAEAEGQPARKPARAKGKTAQRAARKAR